MVSESDDGDAVQRHVALPVAAPVEPVAVGFAAGCGDGARAAEFGERSLVADAFGVVPGDDGDRGRSDGAGAVDVEQGTRVGLEDAAHAFLEQVGLLLECFPRLGGAFERGEHAVCDEAS